MLYILNQLRKTPEIPIKAFTIRGEKKNEIEIVQLILEQYHNISYKPIHVHDDIIDFFPDMVWVLEGYNFKKPLPGTYALAKALSAEGCKAVFMGSGADQQLDFYKANYFPIKAEKWVSTQYSFESIFDLSRVFEEHGEGVYTFYIFESNKIWSSSSIWYNE